MHKIVQTTNFSKWLRGLRDGRARSRIEARLDRLKLGNLGDVRPVGGAVSELRIHYGPGYRVYFMRHGETILVLLAGGDKDSQHRDIARATKLAEEVRNMRWEE